MQRPALIAVPHGIVPARRLCAARAAVEARIAEEREGVGERLRIELGKRVELQGVVAADGELPELRLAHAAPDHTVERLTATAAVGIRRLLPLFEAAVVRKARARVGELARRRAEAGLRPGEQVEVVA